MFPVLCLSLLCRCYLRIVFIVFITLHRILLFALNKVKRIGVNGRRERGEAEIATHPMELFISLAIKLRSKLNIQMRKKAISDKEPQLPFKLEKLLCCCNVAQYLEGSVIH